MFVQPCMFLQLWVVANVHGPCELWHSELCVLHFGYNHLCIYTFVFILYVHVCLCVLGEEASIQVSQSCSISSGRPPLRGTLWA